MQQKQKFAVLLSILIIGTFPNTLANLSVGVQPGDWIVYEVNYTGSPTQGHDIVQAQMEILSVSGHSIVVSMTSKFSDNTTNVSEATLNLDTGDLIDNFIIPANLTTGQTFFDKNFGNITIERIEQRTYAGATRTVCITSTSTNTYIWDQITGVNVEGISHTEEYSIHSIVSETNLWSPSSSELNPASMFMLVGLILIIVMIITAIVVHLWRKRTYKK
ncbi:MAG: hypothetical protein ACM3JE_01285 [Betaproteobacteria bacterium]